MQANISDTPFDQRYLWPTEVDVLQRQQRDRQTHRQADIATLWLNRPGGLIKWNTDFLMLYIQTYICSNIVFWHFYFFMYGLRARRGVILLQTWKIATFRTMVQSFIKVTVLVHNIKIVKAKYIVDVYTYRQIFFLNVLNFI